jgi:hypothetical protein
VVAASVRVDAEKIYGSGETTSPLSQAIKDSDQDKVAEYLSKAACDNNDSTALELRALKSDIVNVLGAYPGLVEYVQSVKCKSDNDKVISAIEDIKTAVRGKSGGCLSCDDNWNKTGAGEKSSSQIAEDVYALMKQYIREVGTSAHVENFLRRRWHLSKTNVSEDVKRDKSIKHKALYQMIYDIVDDNWNIESKEDFIEKTGLRYEHFLPANKRPWLKLADKLDIDIVPELRNELRVYLRSPKTFSNSELDKILNSIEGSLSIWKLAPGYSKKTKPVIEKAKTKAFAVDTLAVLPILKATADSLYDASRWTDAVNLIRELGSYGLRSAEEEAVRRVLLGLSEGIEAERDRARVKSILMNELEREQRLRALEAQHRERLERIEQEREAERQRVMETIPAFNPELLNPEPSAPPMDPEDNTEEEEKIEGNGDNINTDVSFDDM